MIHRYKLGGMNIVLDICSGSVHLVDEVAYDMIGLFETESREAITAAMLEKYGVKGCWYGHIHGRGIASAFEGRLGGVDYRLVSADALDFRPVKILA